MRKFTRRFAVGAMVFGLLATACSGEGGGGSPIGAPDTGEAAGDDAGSESDDSTAGDELEGDPIKVGFLVDKTGALADYGNAHEIVGRAAAERINENGGIDGRPLELVIADTESDPATAAPRARQLVESDGVDFLLGSNTSGVVLAVAGVADETETVYFPTAGGALLTTEENASRYVFDINTDVRQEAIGVTQFISGNLEADTWVTVVADYAWGWDQEQWFAQMAEEAGMEVVNQMRVPLGTNDFLGYLRGGIPDEAEGVFFANFGTDFLAFIRDLKAVRPDIERIGGNYVLSGQDISALGEDAEGMYVVAGYPQSADAIGTDIDAEYRDWIGMDDQGREEESGDRLVASYQWSTWESLNAIRTIVEESGWESRDDTMSFIETLEGFEFEHSLDFPEGPKHFRPEDHLSVKGAWIEQVTDGELEIAQRVEPDELVYEPGVDLTSS